MIEVNNLVVDARQAGGEPVSLGRRRRHDAVDHGAGKSDVVGDPAAKPWVDEGGKTRHHPLERPAVRRQIVAGQHGERRQTR